MGHERRRHALGRDLLRLAAEGEGLGLGEEVGHQQVMVLAQLPGRAVEPDQVAGHEAGPLMDELVEGVLAVGARLPPHDRAGGGLDGAAVDVHRLAVALHVELLEVGGEAPEPLAVGQHRVGLRAQEVAVPDPQEPEQDRGVALDRGGAEVLVHRVEAREELPEALGPDRDGQRQADGRVDRVAAAHPVPEAEHLGAVDAERLDLLGVGGDRHEVVPHGVVGRLARQAAQQPVPRAARVGQGLQRREGLGGDHESVERGSRPSTASRTSTPSMFDTKRTSMAGSARSRSAR